MFQEASGLNTQFDYNSVKQICKAWKRKEPKNIV